MTTQTVPEKLSRASVYSLIAEMIRQGLPAPREVSFRANSITIDLDSIADRLAWQPVFGMRDEIANEQPHPSLTDPAQMDTWITSAWTRWGGWHLSLHGDDPITDEQRRGWMESGRAERHAAYEARQAAKDADRSGLTYSREADDPMPVSPARGGPVHTGAVTDEGLVAVTGAVVRDSSVVLLDEPSAGSLMPAPIAKHYDASDLDEHACACGEEFTGRDSLRSHIEAENAPVHYLDFGSDGEEDDRLTCGKQVREVSQYTDDFAKVTCSVCIRAMAPVSESR